MTAASLSSERCFAESALSLEDRHSPREPRPDAPHSPPPTRTAAESDSGGHILLLDDEEAILRPTATYFRGLGFTVDVARELEEAQALVHHQCYDLAILDLRVGPFGGADGLELLREIRWRHRATSVIVLSAYISPEVEAEARALGADGILCKPQALRDLAYLAFVLIGASGE